jgi:hypothetical protein
MADWRETEAEVASEKQGSGGRAREERVKAAWVVAGWLVRQLHSGGVVATAR